MTGQICPDKEVPGPTYNFLSLKARVRRAFGALTVGGGPSWTPQALYGGGLVWRMQTEVAYTWTRWLTTSAKNVGRAWALRGSNRTFWDAGATITLPGTNWNNIAVDVRYSGTDVSFVQCGYVDWCEPGVTATLQIDFWD